VVLLHTHTHTDIYICTVLGFLVLTVIVSWSCSTTAQ